MKGKMLLFLSGLLIGILSLSFYGVAANTLRKITVHFLPANFMVDGVQVDLGKELFTYKDALYVPLRSVSHLMDKPISWDSKSQTVWLGKQPPNTYVYLNNLKILRTQGEAWEVSDRWNKKEGGQPLQIAGKKFLHGWYQRFWETSSKERDREFLLSDNFSYIEGFVGIDDYTINSPNQANVKIFVDEEEVFSVEGITGGADAIPFKIPLDGKKRLRVSVETFGPSKDPLSVDIAEAKLYYKAID